MKTLQEKWKSLQSQYGRYFPAGFFVFGFLFDVFTLTRIDDWLSILQQGLYLVIVIFILRKKILFDSGIWTPAGRAQRLWTFHNEILHFILGSLLSIYALFFFMSSSLASSFVFLLIVFTLLVINEFPGFQKKGLIVKYALLTLCLFSFFAYLVPMMLGFIGLIPFLISIAIVAILIFVNYSAIKSKLSTHVADTTQPQKTLININKSILLPSMSVLLVVSALYFLRILPPIPLSIQFIGIYHSVEKMRPEDNPDSEQQFVLKYDRPFWKFWQNGAQDFVAFSGDKIFCFVRIFSPANFQDKIIFHWMLRTPKGWETQDRILTDITGGRDQGFRSFVFKSNYQSGDWRILVETADRREIGRINFSVYKESSPAPDEREFRTDLH